MTSTNGENENVVRIMSIHKSKGLEFPVVILAETGSKFNELDINAPLLKKFFRRTDLLPKSVFMSVMM